MILIVDDKPENLISLKGILELHGLEVETASSGEEALKKILKHEYSLIILDVQMPEMDGFEVAEAISGFNKAKDIPIIFLSAVSIDKKFITKGYGSGASDYVTKPVDPDIFLLKVKTFIRLYEQKKELSLMHQALQGEVEVRKKAQADLSVKMQELHSVLESMPQVAFTANNKGEIEYVNDRWYVFSKQPAKFPEVHPDEAHICNDWEASLQSGKQLSAEIRIKELKSGEYKYHLLRTLPIKQEDKIVKWVGTFTDINQQKLINEMLEQRVIERTKELNELNRELGARNEELREFAWVASHDLKEPLRKIQTFSHMMKDTVNDETEEVNKITDRIIDSSERMSRLINDLLNYSSLSNHDFFEEVDLNKIVAQILTDLEVTIKNKKAQISVEPLPVITAISTQMRQLFQNLISNSIKFSKKNTVPVIKISCERVAEKNADSPADKDGNYYRIQVSDNGIGFDEKYIDKIFTIFQRLKSRDEYEGTGIGLSITKKIAERHNGLITAHSHEGEGATFIIILPATQIKKQE